MNIAVDQLNPQTRCIRLSGRLDLKGSDEIAQRFTSLTATDRNHVIVDMREVQFIASIGMRLLLSCAKAKSNRGGQLVLVGLQPSVREALETAGIESLIRIYADEAVALTALPE
ncbi:MAG: STAS domain-containing protein [Thiobacillaceae bacterium]